MEGGASMYRLDERQQKKLDYEKRIAVAVVHSSATGLGALLQNPDFASDPIKLIRTFASPIRFYNDGSGYFFVFDYAGLCLVHSNPKVEGSNMFNYHDATGNYFVRKMIDIAQRNGGFMDYYWPKPGSDEGSPQPKIGYVEPIPGTQCLIGAGLYTGE
jgi:signal transduction histidine kinase